MHIWCVYVCGCVCVCVPQWMATGQIGAAGVHVLLVVVRVCVLATGSVPVQREPAVVCPAWALSGRIRCVCRLLVTVSSTHSLRSSPHVC